MKMKGRSLVSIKIQYHLRSDFNFLSIFPLCTILTNKISTHKLHKIDIFWTKSLINKFNSFVSCMDIITFSNTFELQKSPTTCYQQPKCHPFRLMLKQTLVKYCLLYRSAFIVIRKYLLRGYILAPTSYNLYHYKGVKSEKYQN